MKSHACILNTVNSYGKEEKMNDTVSATPKKMSVKTIAVIGVLTAVTCILAPLSIPIGDVPISLTNLVIYFGLYILGTRRETVSYIVYLLIGLVGVPVFSGFTAYLAKCSTDRRLSDRVYSDGCDRRNFY